MCLYHQRWQRQSDAADLTRAVMHARQMHTYEADREMLPEAYLTLVNKVLVEGGEEPFQAAQASAPAAAASTVDPLLCAPPVDPLLSEWHTLRSKWGQPSAAIDELMTMTGLLEVKRLFSQLYAAAQIVRLQKFDVTKTSAHAVFFGHNHRHRHISRRS